MTESSNTRGTPTPGLTQQQGVLLTFETQAVANLMRDGTAALRLMTHSSRGADTVWTLLSLGAEKLLKLTIGLAQVEVDGCWPGARIRKYSHNVVSMDT